MHAPRQPAPPTDDPSWHAAQCRRLASGPLPYDLVLELEALADEYEGRVLVQRPVQPRVRSIHLVRSWLKRALGIR